MERWPRDAAVRACGSSLRLLSSLLRPRPLPPPLPPVSLLLTLPSALRSQSRKTRATISLAAERNAVSILRWMVAPGSSRRRAAHQGRRTQPVRNPVGHKRRWPSTHGRLFAGGSRVPCLSRRMARRDWKRLHIPGPRSSALAVRLAGAAPAVPSAAAAAASSSRRRLHEGRTSDARPALPGEGMHPVSTRRRSIITSARRVDYAVCCVPCAVLSVRCLLWAVCLCCLP